MKSKKIKIFIGIAAVFTVAILFRGVLLSSIGSFLIEENELVKCDAIVVLGGNPKDRGTEALRLYKSGWADKVLICGGNIPYSLEAIDSLIPEAYITNILFERENITTELLINNSSTKEEAEEVKLYAQENSLKNIIIVTDKFHTSRALNVFESEFENTGVNIIMRGSESSQYDEAKWWGSEEGLIMVNNEYMKHLYYLIKY